jgi:molybdenum cofactor cytidylyltransferase
MPLDASGATLGVVAAHHLLEALPNSIAVVRAGDRELSAKLRATGLRVVPCRDADAGMGASLACGVLSSKDAEGWVVALADMPWIAPATIRAIVDALASGADIVAPSYRGRRGHPVGFSRRHYAALASLTGDSGARALIERDPARLAAIDVDDSGVLRDVDRPEELGAPTC